MTKREEIKTTVEFEEGLWGPRGKVVIPVQNLVEIVLHAIGDDKAKVREFLRFFSFEDIVRGIIVDQLCEEHSTPHMWPDLHKERRRLMEAMEEKEIYYLANEMSGKIEDGQRERQDYYRLYHAVVDHGDKEGCNAFEHKGFEIPKRSPIDWDARRAGELLIEGLFKSKLPKKCAMCGGTGAVADPDRFGEPNQDTVRQCPDCTPNEASQ